VNHSAKKQHHEKTRKKHKHDQQEHARELARQQPSTRAAWVLGIGVGLVIIGVIVAIALS
jgi:ABC-type nickel/cobalt efflux system permease component RcnA